MTKNYTVLIIDDKKENLKYLNEILKDENYEIKASIDAKFAIESSKNNPPHLILLDIKMPELDGFEVCKIIKKEENLKDIPIIFISALDDIDSKVKAFSQGGVDYITKPFEPKEIKARVRTQLEIYKSKITIASLLEQQDLFVKKIMHEMNTPVSIISLNTELIEQKYGLSKEIESIRASSKTLSSIYGDLSYKVKKESREYKITKINLLKFISSRIQFFDELANTKDIHINLEYSEELEVFINSYEFERLIDNTISNAIKYSKESSEIDVFFGIEDNKTIISIEDFGIGIEDTELIFEEYYQKSNKKLGLGLGLNIVKEICDKYEIVIDIKSEKNRGTKFIFDIEPITKKSI